jgi:hypothetical protein
MALTGSTRRTAVANNLSNSASRSGCSAVGSVQASGMFSDMTRR